MTNDLSPAARPGSVALGNMTIEELRAELAKSLSITAAHMQHLAAIWRELERRGEDLSDLKSGLWSFMPLIARGDLKAELVVKYAGYTTLLRRLATLPLAEQENLLVDDVVTVIEHVNGAWVEHRKALRDLRSTEALQVINERILPPAEQKRRALSITQRSPRKVADKIVLQAQKLKLDTTAPHKTISATITEDEAAALSAAAQDAGVSVSRIVRAALDVSGLFKKVDL